MKVSEFDFVLPPELVAQEPSADRSGARLLHLDRDAGVLGHTAMSELPTLLDAGDLLVVNNTRVFPARLLGKRTPSGGAVECVLLGQESGAVVSDRTPAPARGQVWEALVHPGQKLKPGSHIVFDGTTMLRAEILERRSYGRRLIRLWTEDDSPVDAAVDAIGHVPLPPYIKRVDGAADRERYQTIFADRRGSIAAPTAGLHFSAALVARLKARGVQFAEITLHVGYGTFQPVRVDDVEQHRLEPERYEIGGRAAAAINLALAEGRRVIAVGTTTTRTLEASAREHDGLVSAGSGATGLFIYPGFEFRVIRGLLTNFHVPRSSLLMLVSAFAGRERVLAAYEEAVAKRYRFYSYGDAMLIL